MCGVNLRTFRVSVTVSLWFRSVRTWVVSAVQDDCNDCFVLWWTNGFFFSTVLKQTTDFPSGSGSWRDNKAFTVWERRQRCVGVGMRGLSLLRRLFGGRFWCPKYSQTSPPLSLWSPRKSERDRGAMLWMSPFFFSFLFHLWLRCRQVVMATTSQKQRGYGGGRERSFVGSEESLQHWRARCTSHGIWWSGCNVPLHYRFLQTTSCTHTNTHR